MWPATNETVVYGLGELHLRVLLERLREVHRFEVDTAPPRIAYRETITAPAEGHHRHKKQTGGAGQFGEVFLRVEPLPRGGGFEFVDAGQGRRHPGAVHPGGREGRARGAGQRRHRRLPGGRRARHGLRRQAPQRGQQGDRLRHRRPQGLPGRGARGAADRAGADRARSRSPRPTARLGDITGDLSASAAWSAAPPTASAGDDGRARPGAAVGTGRLPDRG